MSFIKRLIYSVRVMEGIYPLCGGAVLLLLGIVTLLSSQCHPIYVLMLLPRSALPFWLFALLGILLFFLLGVGAGCLFALPGCKKQGYFPLLLYVTATVLMISWYHVLFRSFGILTSAFLLLAILCLQILAIRKTAQHNPLSAVVTAIACLITLHFIWLNIGLLFLN